eukprot:4568302-Karenia_brevis.AAC.1
MIHRLQIRILCMPACGESGNPFISILIAIIGTICRGVLYQMWGSGVPSWRIVAGKPKQSLTG